LLKLQSHLIAELSSQSLNIHDASVAGSESNFVPPTITPAAINKMAPTTVNSTHIPKAPISENTLALATRNSSTAVEIAADAEPNIDIDRHGSLCGRRWHGWSEQQQSYNTKYDSA
jgi:hypothetical protein